MIVIRNGLGGLEFMDPADPTDQVSLDAVRDLPSTRAGGQDDVSSKQAPSKLDEWPPALRFPLKRRRKHHCRKALFFEPSKFCVVLYSLSPCLNVLVFIGLSV